MILRFFTLPSNLVIVCFALGVVTVTVKRWRTVSLVFFCLAGTVYVFFASGPVSFRLLKNLENRYPPIDILPIPHGVDTIVVLTGYGKRDAEISESSTVNTSSAFRIMETLRILRQYPGMNVIVTGSGEASAAMKGLMTTLGVKDGRITRESKSSNTYESAVNLKEFLSGKTMILVTSAGHMPRSVEVFRKQGMHPIPAPTDYMTRKNYRATSYLPTPNHLVYFDLAMHEYLGLLWYRITGYL